MFVRVHASPGARGGGGGDGGDGGDGGMGGVDGETSAQLTRAAHPEKLSDILICATQLQLEQQLLQNAAPTVGPDVTV